MTTIKEIESYLDTREFNPDELEFISTLIEAIDLDELDDITIEEIMNRVAFEFGTAAYNTACEQHGRIQAVDQALYDERMTQGFTMVEGDYPKLVELARAYRQE